MVTNTPPSNIGVDPAGTGNNKYSSGVLDTGQKYADTLTPTQYAQQYGAPPIQSPIDTKNYDSGSTMVNTDPAPVNSGLKTTASDVSSSSQQVLDFLSGYKTQIDQQSQDLKTQNAELTKQLGDATSFSQADTLKQQQEQYQIPEQYQSLLALQPDIINLNNELNTIKANEQAEIALVQSQPGALTGVVSAQQTQIERRYAVKIAATTAELSAKTAIASMYQGNIDTATKLVDQTVNAMVYDVTQRKDDLKYFINRNDTYINSLDTKSQNLLDKAFSELQTEEKNKRDDYYFKLGLIQDAAGKYVDLGLSTQDLQNMTSEEVLAKYDEKMGASSPVSVHFETINGNKVEVITDKRTGEVISQTDLGSSGSSSSGSSSDGYKFTDTQVNKGSIAAGVDANTFRGLPGEVQNEFINNADFSTFVQSVVDAWDNGGKPIDLINKSNYSDGVKNWVRQLIIPQV